MQPLECIECGKSEGKHQGLCDKCFLKHNTALVFPEYVDVVVCPHCGVLKRGEHWLQMHDIMGVVEHAVREAAKPGPRVSSWDAELDIIEETPQVFRVKINASLYIEGLAARVEAFTTARIASNVCDVCSRRHGGYYESIVQLRGYNAPLGKDMMGMMAALAGQIVERLAASNRHVFMSKYEDIHGGLDFYLSTTDAGRNLSREFSHKTGGHVKESARMAGRKDGKDIYRTTFSVRLPPFKKGDYIELGSEVYRMVKVARDRVDMLLLKTGEPVRRRRDFDDAARILGGEELIKEAVVVFDGGDELQVMDPETYATVQVRKPAHYETDEVAQVIKHNGQLFIA